MAENRGRLAFGGVQTSYSYIPGYGKLEGKLNATQMPDLVIEQVFFRAKLDNSGTIYIGTDENVTADNGVPLEAKDFFPWAPIKNLSHLWYVCESADDDLIFFIVR